MREFKECDTHTVTVQRRAQTISASGAGITTWSTNLTGISGAGITTWSTNLTGISCIIQFTGGNITINNEAERDRFSHTMYCDSGLDIISTDRINDNGTYYDIVNINDQLRSSHMEIDLNISRVNRN
jgi:hypothetical protein